MQCYRAHKPYVLGKFLHERAKRDWSITPLDRPRTVIHQIHPCLVRSIGFTQDVKLLQAPLLTITSTIFMGAHAGSQKGNILKRLQSAPSAFRKKNLRIHETIKYQLFKDGLEVSSPLSPSAALGFDGACLAETNPA